MKLLVLTSVYPTPEDYSENVTKVVKFFANEWAKSGHEVVVIHNVHRYPILIHACPKWIKRKLASILSFYIPDVSSVTPIKYNDNGVRVYRFPVLKVVPHGNHSIFSLKRQVKRIEKAISSLNFTPDVIMGHWMSPQIQLITLLREKIDCKTSLVLHGREYVEGKRFNYSKYLNAVDVIGCRSFSDADYFYHKMGLTQIPFVCYSGIPDWVIGDDRLIVSKFSSIPKTWNIIYVGRLVKYKNVDYLIKALSKCDGIDYRLEVIGDGPEYTSLVNLAKELKISSKVEFYKHMSREKVIEHMRSAHIFAMVSTGEAFGLVYLEAMASGCLTIATAGGGIDGVIVNSENGFLCRDEVDSLKDTLLEITSMTLQQFIDIAGRGILTASKYTDSYAATQYLNNVIDN